MRTPSRGTLRHPRKIKKKKTTPFFEAAEIQLKNGIYKPPTAIESLSRSPRRTRNSSHLPGKSEVIRKNSLALRQNSNRFAQNPRIIFAGTSRMFLYLPDDFPAILHKQFASIANGFLMLGGNDECRSNRESHPHRTIPERPIVPLGKFG